MSIPSDYLARLHESVAAVAPIYGVGGQQGAPTVDYKPEATPVQITDGNAAAAAFDWSDHAHATWLAQKEKAQATSAVDDAFLQNGNRVERIVMSVATSAIKVINKDRDTFAAMNTAVQAATSLADLKTRFAAITFPPQITNQQLINSIKADIASTPE